jgi:Zn-dependent protease
VPPETAIEPSPDVRLRLRRLFAGGALALLAPAFGLLPGGDPLAIVLTLVLLVLSLGIHEAAHAWAALKCGDPTARDLGRLTLNPLPHIDLMWTIVLPAVFLLTSGFLFGGAKPVPVDFHRLRNPWRDMSFVAFAGPFSNLLLAILFLALWKFFVTTGLYNDASPSVWSRTGDLLPRVLDAAVGLNVLLFVFNLIPIPPLDGSRILTWLLPAGLREPYNAIGGYGLIVVFVLMSWGPFGSLVHSLMRSVDGWIERLVSLGGLW